MQNNDLIGRVVFSKCGRDRDETYIIVKVINDRYVLVANGKNKRFNEGKKKNLMHLDITDYRNVEICKAIESNEKNTDLMIKRFLKIRGIVKEG